MQIYGPFNIYGPFSIHGLRGRSLRCSSLLFTPKPPALTSPTDDPSPDVSGIRDVGVAPVGLPWLSQRRLSVLLFLVKAGDSRAFIYASVRLDKIRKHLIKSMKTCFFKRL